MLECCSISKIDFCTSKILTTDSIENLSDNVELETCDGQLLLTT